MWTGEDSEYISLTAGAAPPCQYLGLDDILDTDECQAAAISLDLVDSNYVLPVTKQSELDLAYGCGVQTHGNHLIRVNINANSTGMATKSNIVICRKPVGKLKLKMRKINFRYIILFFICSLIEFLT